MVMKTWATPIEPDDRSYAEALVTARERSRSRKTNAEFEGALGEIVFARFFGLPLPPIVRKKGDGGVDFVMPTGASVDCKTISGDNGERLGLLVPHRIRAGLYVLIHLDDGYETATLLGYQTGGWAAMHGEDRFNHYRVDQKDLRPIGELTQHAKVAYE